ncbi:unnamed protein product, partial [Heterosigma akashiwo]
KTDTSKTVLELKEQIAEQATVPAPQQRLIYKGRVLKDDQTLESYSVAEAQTIHLVKGSAAGPSSAAAPANSISQAAPAPAPSATGTSPPAGIPNLFGGGLGNAGSDPL